MLDKQSLIRKILGIAAEGSRYTRQYLKSRTWEQLQAIDYRLSLKVAKPADRAEAIVQKKGQISQNADGSFTVRSQSKHNESYTVRGTSCTCPQFQYRGGPCKHVLAVREYVAEHGLAEKPVRKVVTVAVPRFTKTDLAEFLGGACE
jgi:hypothetical protein